MREMRIVFKKLLFIVILMAMNLPSTGQDWQQWRGPNRDGILPNFDAPETYPERLNIRWSIDAGPGVSSPIVGNGKVFLMTRNGDEELVSCYNFEDGALAWQDRYPAKFVANAQANIPRWFPASKGKGPFSTPILYENRLYTLGIDRVFSCYNAESGKALWRHHYFPVEIPDTFTYECPPCGCGEDGKVFEQAGTCSACNMAFSARGLETSASSIGNYYGSVSSPIIEGELVIIHVGNNEHGSVIAHDRISGEKQWEWKGPAMASSSPVISEIDGARQFISMTRTFVFAVSPDTGELLWEFPIENNAQIITPIVAGNLVIFAEYRGPLRALQIKKHGANWSAAELWTTSDLTVWTSTPVYDNQLLYGFFYSQKGQFASIDVKTGNIIWKSEGRQGAAASLVSGGNHLFALKEDGQLVIMAKNTASFEAVRTYTVANSPTWTYPVISGNRFLIKDESALTLWETN